MQPILLVDRDPGSRALLARFLDHRGLAVEEAGSPSMALSMIGGRRPRLIVTELFRDMPRFADRLCRVAPDLPVLVWTSRTDREARLLIESLGFHFVPKPSAPQDVAFRIARVLAETGSRAVRPSDDPGQLHSSA